MSIIHDDIIFLKVEFFLAYTKRFYSQLVRYWCTGRKTKLTTRQCEFCLFDQWPLILPPCSYCLCTRASSTSDWSMAVMCGVTHSTCITLLDRVELKVYRFISSPPLTDSLHSLYLSLFILSSIFPLCHDLYSCKLSIKASRTTLDAILDLFNSYCLTSDDIRRAFSF